jgi:hypothetical protein
VPISEVVILLQAEPSVPHLPAIFFFCHFLFSPTHIHKHIQYTNTHLPTLPFFLLPLIQAFRNVFGYVLLFDLVNFQGIYCCSSCDVCVDIGNVASESSDFSIFNVFLSDLVPFDS